MTNLKEKIKSNEKIMRKFLDKVNNIANNPSFTGDHQDAELQAIKELNDSVRAEQQY